MHCRRYSKVAYFCSCDLPTLTEGHCGVCGRIVYDMAHACPECAGDVININDTRGVDFISVMSAAALRIKPICRLATRTLASFLRWRWVWPLSWLLHDEIPAPWWLSREGQIAILLSKLCKCKQPSELLGLRYCGSWRGCLGWDSHNDSAHDTSVEG